MTNSTPRRWWQLWRYRIPLILLSIPLLLIVLVLFNTFALAARETPTSSLSPEQLAAAAEGIEQPQLKVLAYNIAKGFAHIEGLSFEDEQVVRDRMLRVAELIRAEQPDLVFLCEAIFECGPCPVDQVELIAKEAGYDYWVCGENYNLGLPFYRVVGGNAILSRHPIRPVDNPSLAGRKPFYVTKNSRRVLYAELNINGRDVLLGSIHNDSFDMQNNTLQMQQILDYVGDRDAILAGDFNAKPDERPIELVRQSGRFSGELNGPLTFSAKNPQQTIDFIFAPAAWKLLEHRVINNDASDHLPIVSTFEVPGFNVPAE